MSPYAGVPPSKTADMEACVKKVMADGKSKDSAIAICHASIMGKEAVMTNHKPGKRERRAMRDEAARAADRKDMALPDADPPDVELPDVSEPEPDPVLAYGGATSFAAFDEWVAKEHDAAYETAVGEVFRELLDNVLSTDAAPDRAEAVRALTDEYEKRLATPPEEARRKGVLEWVSEKLGFGKAEKLAADKPAEEKKEASFIVRKEADGSYRWFGWVTNKWRDLDVLAHPAKGGEILTEAAHKEFIAYLDARPDAAPELWAWHTPGTKHGQADWWDYADGFVVMSGPLTEAAGKSFENETEPLGMSHGFFAIPPWRDTANGLINKYRTFEASHLPLARAANPWTDFETIRKEAAMFNPEKREYLVKRLGEEVVAGLEADTKGRAALLEAIGIESKQTDDAEAPPAPPIPPVTEPKVVADTKTDQPGIVTEDPAETAPVAEKAPVAPPAQQPDPAQTIEAVLKKLDIPGLNVYLKTLTDKVEAQAATIKTLEAGVKAATLSLDEKIATIITPQVSAVIPLWSQRPSQSAETVLTESDEDKALKTAGPRASWVSDAIKPVQ